MKIPRKSLEKLLAAKLQEGTIHGIGPIALSFSLNKPHCIRVTFKGCKLVGLDKQVQWNSTQPNSFQEPETSDDDSEGLFDNILNF